MNDRNFFNDPSVAVTRNILIINLLVALAATVSHKVQPSFDWYSYLSLHFWKSSAFHPAQLFSYMFLHSLDWSHVLFNMFSLFMFGRLLEQVLGAKKFLIYYAFCGVGAAIVQEITWTIDFWPMLQEMERCSALVSESVSSGTSMVFSNISMEFNSVEQWNTYCDQILCRPTTVGASGAVFGILLAFGMLFPELPMFLMFIPVPVKAKYMVIGYAALELFLGVHGAATGVAHFAHLGGMLFGVILILYWRKKGEIGRFM